MNNTKYSFVIEDNAEGLGREETIPYNKQSQEMADIKIYASNNISSSQMKNKAKEFISKLQQRNKISYLIISITFGISSLSDLAVTYFFKDTLNVQPADLSRLTSISLIPWFLKPFFGLLTDLIPICGYRRKIYIILCGLLDCLCWILMTFINEGIGSFVMLLFMHNCCLSFTTVLGEAIVVELSKISELESEDQNSTNEIKDKTSNAKNYVSYFFFFKYLGSLFSSLFKGILVKNFALKTVFFISSFIPLLFVLSGIILLEETPYMQAERFRDNEKLLELETQMNVNQKSSSLREIKTVNKNLMSTNTESCPAQFFGFLCQKHILIPIIFTIIFVGTPSYSDPMFYFFTETLKLDSIDLGIISMFSTLATMGAILLYRFYFKNKSFRSIITYGSFVAFFVSFSAYLLVTRYNIKLGIPDFPFIIFSYSFMSMLGELIAMPLLSLAAVLSPQNLEGTSYSVFMSAINFGGILSNLLGSMLTNMLGITKTDYSNLPELILIANFISLLPLPFLFCLNKSYFDPQVKECNVQIKENLNQINNNFHVRIENMTEQYSNSPSNSDEIKREDVLDGTGGLEIEN
jgi:MFS family permease